jgi:hypothetical protein
MIENLAETHKAMELKTASMEAMVRNINELKIENAEYRALAKDY